MKRKEERVAKRKMEEKEKAKNTTCQLKLKTAKKVLKYSCESSNSSFKFPILLYKVKKIKTKGHYFSEKF